MDERATIKISRQLKDTLENLDGQFMTDKIESLLTERKNQEQQPCKQNVDKLNQNVDKNVDNVDIKGGRYTDTQIISELSLELKELNHKVDRIISGLNSANIKC